MGSMKPVTFLGDSLKRLRDFPVDARSEAGRQLDAVQKGRQPADFKPMPGIGPGVEEIRSGAFRGIYTARRAEAVYVLHAFQKKTQQTGKADIELARKRYLEITRSTA